MSVCRAARLSAASLDASFKSSGWLMQQVRARTLRNVTLTLRKGHTFQRYCSFCVSARGVESALTHLGKQAEPLRYRSSSALTNTDWAHLSGVAVVGVNLCRSTDSQGCYSGIFRRNPPGHVLFTGTMQPNRAATSSAAQKKEPTADSNNKEDEINSKEASATYSPTAETPGGAGSDGGKPNKTQQLKKVFKEYGAVGVCFHTAISLLSLQMFYLLVSSGIDMAAVLCKLGFSEAIIQSKMAAGTSTFVLAYAIHKLFAPVLQMPLPTQ
ncbi:protein FAM210B, mitochondrial isoform 2-T2 [Aulostomus maculatus]